MRMSTVLRIITANREPFAVKSGGYASNPRYSSTTGVHISLANLTQVTLSEDKSTVVLGTGNIWADVFSTLDGTAVNVVGGRVFGPGVGGFTLRGSYSWLTDQYGLTCDTVVSYNPVLPNSTITTVNSTDPNLFFALKGGLNRFGIVTSIVLKTVPQMPMVYGGFIVYGVDAIPDLITATNKFQNENTDPKAQVILTINNGLIQGAILIMFYDGPSRPAAFDPYNNVSSLPIISSVKT
ncbi:hypothetical protein EAF04_004635 [Stromatinia cepivora]|nr:hypothetical protein EAF04_004635 [Stromatinia cepivora]